MAIATQQIKMSNAMISGVQLDAQELGLGESRLITFPRVEEQTSGYYSDYQYPDNRKSFDGQAMVVTDDSGLEMINNSKTANILG